MIKYLQRMKGKKGFTIVELIVVMGIIAVLVSIVMVNMIGGNTDKQLAANSNARAFLTASQLTFTRAQLTERSVVTYADTDTQYVKYDKGVNKITGRDGRTDNFLFVEVKSEQRGIVGLHISDTFDQLMNMADPASTNMTTLEKYIQSNIANYLADSYEGYFYALVDNDFKVRYAHFCESRLPVRSAYSSSSDFRDALVIDPSGRLVGNEAILGTCSDDYIMPATGYVVFSMPAATEGAYGLYIDTKTPIT